MAKRDNNYSRTKDRRDYKTPENIELSLDYLEVHGKLKPRMVLPSRYINPRCLDYYGKVIKINNIIKSFEYDCLQDANNINANNQQLINLRLDKSDLQTKILNLSAIVIGAVIKKFKTLYPAHYEDVFTACVLDILDKINRDKYDGTKASFHSYMYEVSYQAIIKYIDEKASYENNAVALLQD